MMKRSSRFRLQHHELSLLGTAVIVAMHKPGFADDIMPAFRALARFTGKLKIHAAMEDEALYPWLGQHENATFQDIGATLRQSVGPLYQAFFAFEAEWTPDAARESPMAFAQAAQALLSKLHERMELENREIYDVLDAYEEGATDAGSISQ